MVLDGASGGEEKGGAAGAIEGEDVDEAPCDGRGLRVGSAEEEAVSLAAVKDALACERAVALSPKREAVGEGIVDRRLERLPSEDLADALQRGAQFRGGSGPGAAQRQGAAAAIGYGHRGTEPRVREVTRGVAPGQDIVGIGVVRSGCLDRLRKGTRGRKLDEEPGV